MIYKDPHECLHTLCDPVDFKEGKRIAKRLREEYKIAQDNAKDMFVVGLAAPQIGVPKNVFIALGDVFINPKIIHRTLGWNLKSKEGCLSLPDIYTINRFGEIQLMWQDEARRLKQMTFQGTNAVILQHEYDHLQGVLCNERQIAPKVEGSRIAVLDKL